MRTTTIRYVLSLLVAGLIVESDGLHLIAYFDQADVRGFAQFEQIAMGSNVSITFNFTANLRSFDRIGFKITTNPSVYDDWCTNVGDVVYNMSKWHGYLAHNSHFTDDHIMIMGKDSVLGRSLVLVNATGHIFACSTILPHSDVIYADARVNSPEVGGHFTFIRSTMGGDTFIYGQLQHVSDTSRHIYTVHISADTADHDTCAPYNQIYNPIESSGNCSQNQEAACKIGDLSGKHGTLEFGDGEGRLIGVDTNLPLSGDYSVISRYVVIRLKGETRNVACAKIEISGPLEVESAFDAAEHKGIHGDFKFTQQSPYHFTKVSIELEGLGGRVNGYHVHLFPISDSKNPCSGSSVGGHVNTWNVDIKQSPAPLNGSLDKYEVGDLSGRYGGLRNKTSISLNKDDANIPLYGLYTILGRSIVIHEDKPPTNPRFVCADIVPVKPKLKMSSFANLLSGMRPIGIIRANQWVQENGIATGTTIVVDIPTRVVSNDHIWSIHENPVQISQDGYTCPTFNSSGNPIYNPVRMNRGTFCNKRNPLLCMVGDLSGKLGRFNMGSGKSFFNDANLPMLTGRKTAIGHSIVIYQADGSYDSLACGNIIPGVGKVVSRLEFVLQDKSMMNNKSEILAMLMNGFEFPQRQAYRITSLATTITNDDAYDEDCFRVSFFLMDTNRPPHASAYKCTLKDILDSPAKMAPFKRCDPKRKKDDDSSALHYAPSVMITALLSMLVTLVL